MIFFLLCTSFLNIKKPACFYGLFLFFYTCLGGQTNLFVIILVSESIIEYGAFIQKCQNVLKFCVFPQSSDAWKYISPVYLGSIRVFAPERYQTHSSDLPPLYSIMRIVLCCIAIAVPILHVNFGISVPEDFWLSHYQSDMSMLMKCRLCICYISSLCSG